jgi:hypothetical protein
VANALGFVVEPLWPRGVLPEVGVA